jgi:hypothetical protein
MNRVRTYRIARNMISAEFYVILGLIDDLEIESNKVAHGIDHADIRWRLSLHSSKRWAYNFRTNVLFCWSRLSIDEKDAILEHMKDRYGVSVGRFDDSGPGYV